MNVTRKCLKLNILGVRIYEEGQTKKLGSPLRILHGDYSTLEIDKHTCIPDSWNSNIENMIEKSVIWREQKRLKDLQTTSGAYVFL